MCMGHRSCMDSEHGVHSPWDAHALLARWLFCPTGIAGWRGSASCEQGPERSRQWTDRSAIAALRSSTYWLDAGAEGEHRCPHSGQSLAPV